MLDIDAILDDVDCPKKSSKSSSLEHPDNCRDDREYADEDNDADEDVVVERNPQNQFLLYGKGQSGSFLIIT